MSERRLGWEEIWAARELDPIARAHTGAPEADVVRFAQRLRAEGRRRVLDLGCGIGRHLSFLAGAGFEACGVDVSPTAVAIAGESMKAQRLPGGAVQAEMTHLPFREAFDAALAWNVVYHALVGQVIRATAELARVLRPGGLLLVTFNSIENDAVQRARVAAASGGSRELEPDTFVMVGDPGDKGLPHHYTTEQEIRERLLPGFLLLEVEHRRSGALRNGGAHRTARFVVLARRE